MNSIKQKCDFCKEQALYDGKTTAGPWAFMCQAHFNFYGVKVEGLYTVLEKKQMKKRCITCGQEKPIDQFYTYKDGNGIERTRNDCNVCYQSNRKITDMRRKMYENKPKT